MVQVIKTLKVSVDLQTPGGRVIHLHPITVQGIVYKDIKSNRFSNRNKTKKKKSSLFHSELENLSKKSLQEWMTDNFISSVYYNGIIMLNKTNFVKRNSTIASESRDTLTTHLLVILWILRVFQVGGCDTVTRSNSLLKSTERQQRECLTERSVRLT